MTFWPKFIQQCNSRVSAIVRRHYNSRNYWKKLAEQHQQTIRELEEVEKCLQRRTALLEKAIAESQQKAEKLKEISSRISTQTRAGTGARDRGKGRGYLWRTVPH